jgi:copper chaperone CopZ
VKQQNFTIPKISCNHCIKTIQSELMQIKGVTSVEGDPQTRQISVVWSEPASEKEIRRILSEMNYPAQP